MAEPLRLAGEVLAKVVSVPPPVSGTARPGGTDRSGELSEQDAKTLGRFLRRYPLDHPAVRYLTSSAPEVIMMVLAATRHCSEWSGIRAASPGA